MLIADKWYTRQPIRNELRRSLTMNTLRRIPSDFLVAKPSFSSGIARLIDFGCFFDSYNKSATPAEADFRATLADWLSVGFDVVDAADCLEGEEKIA